MVKISNPPRRPSAKSPVILLLLGVYWLVGCSAPNLPNEQFTEQDTTVERIQEVDILYSDSAIVKVRIQGPVLLRYQENNLPRQEFPNGIRVSFFGPGGKVTSTLTGRYASRNEWEGITVVRDSVVWEGVDGKKLESTEITWLEKEQKVFTNKFVVVNTLKEIIFAQGFTANQNFTDIRFKAIDGTLMVVDPE